MPQTRASGKLLITADIQFKSLFMVWGPRPEAPWSGIGSAMVGAVTQQGPSSRASAWNQLPWVSPCEPSPGAQSGSPSQCQQLALSSADKAPGWERICSGSLQHSCLQANTLLLRRIQHFSQIILSFCFTLPTAKWSKLLGNCRSVGGVWGINLEESAEKKGNLLWYGKLVVYNCW